MGCRPGLFYEEAYPAPADEVTQLARVVARHGGVYATHLRSEMAQIIEALHEAGDTAFAAGVPLVISHHKCAGPANWGRTLETLPLIESLARRQNDRDGRVPLRRGLDRAARRPGRRRHRRPADLERHPSRAHRPHALRPSPTDWGVDQKTACRRLQPGGACYFQMNEEDVERVIRPPAAP